MSGFALVSLGPERLVAIDGDPDAAALAGCACMRLGESEHMLIGVAAADLPPVGDALAIDVGDAWEGWSLTGSGADALLARICTLDLDGLRPGAATRTAMGGISVLLRRTVDAGWELRVERSYAAWFEAWLRQA